MNEQNRNKKKNGDQKIHTNVIFYLKGMDCDFMDISSPP